MCLRKSAFERILRARDEEDVMCKTCGSGDVDEYEGDLADLAEDGPAWAYALAREGRCMTALHQGRGRHAPRSGVRRP